MGDQNKRMMVKNTGLILLSEGKSIRIKAHGYSMFPNIRPGSMILIEPVGIKGPPVPGEIIAIETDNGMIIHRFIRIVVKNNKKMFIARGDSNTFADLPMPLNRIAGRVTGAETTAENNIPADIKIKTRHKYLANRMRVMAINLWKKVKKSI
jgi:signal peptidase I